MFSDANKFIRVMQIKKVVRENSRRALATKMRIALMGNPSTVASIFSYGEIDYKDRLFVTNKECLKDLDHARAAGVRTIGRPKINPNLGEQSMRISICSENLKPVPYLIYLHWIHQADAQVSASRDRKCLSPTRWRARGAFFMMPTFLLRRSVVNILRGCSAASIREGRSVHGTS
jgi:hypothetical protein